MFIPKAVFDLFGVAKTSIDLTREELAAVRAERDLIKLQLAISQNQFDWLRLRVNTLEVERAQLLEKAYGIKTLVPEIARQMPNIQRTLETMSTALFEDVGDEEARKLGYPSYDLPNN
jgi:predicted nuclease with TOPRIM domain